jgi:hypothetical protein
MNKILFFLLTIELCSCSEAVSQKEVTVDYGSVEIRNFEFDTDSSHSLILYSFDQGSFGECCNEFAILKRNQTIKNLRLYTIPTCFQNPHWISNDTIEVTVDWFSNLLKSNHDCLSQNIVNGIVFIKHNFNKIEKDFLKKILINKTSPDEKYKVTLYKYDKRDELRDSIMHISISNKNDEIPLYGNLYITDQKLFNKIEDIVWVNTNKLKIIIKESPTTYKRIDYCKIIEPLDNFDIIRKIKVEIEYIK